MFVWITSCNSTSRKVACDLGFVDYKYIYFPPFWLFLVEQLFLNGWIHPQHWYLHEFKHPFSIQKELSRARFLKDVHYNTSNSL